MHAEINTLEGKPPRGVRGRGGAEGPEHRVRQRHAHPRTRPPRTRPGRWERVRVRASPTRHATHLAPPQPRWRVAANYSSGSASSRVPSSPASPWLAPGLGTTAEAAALVRGVRPCALGPGEPGDRRWLRGSVQEGCGRAGERVCVGRCGRRRRRLRRHLSSRAAPAARASSVAVRGARARLLLPPPRSAAPRPTSEEKGRSGRPRKEGGWVRACVVRPGVPVEQAWEGAHAVAAAGTATQGDRKSVV